MLLSRKLKEHLISPLTGLSVMFQKDNSAVHSERQVQILTSGLSVGSQGEATLIMDLAVVRSHMEKIQRDAATSDLCHVATSSSH